MPLLGDRQKRWSILLPTGVLPHDARVSLRRAGLARLEEARVRRAAFLVVGHPKSGNTWLRTMISRLYQLRYGLPSSLIAKSDELHRVNRSIPYLLSSNGHYSYEGVLRDLLADDGTARELHDKPVIFLTRHPCDIVTSWYLQYTKRISDYKRELIDAELAHPIDHRRVSRWEFAMNTELGLPFLIEFLNGWERTLAAHPRCIQVRYEDLRNDTEATLRRVATHIGEFSDEEVRGAVDFGSFDNLSRLETEGHFKAGGLGLRKVKDPEARKVRRGKIGGYRDDFTPEQVAELEAMVASKLSPSLGYSGDARESTGQSRAPARHGA